jgi:hypothetical protein
LTVVEQLLEVAGKIAEDNGGCFIFFCRDRVGWLASSRDGLV